MVCFQGELDVQDRLDAVDPRPHHLVGQPLHHLELRAFHGEHVDLMTDEQRRQEGGEVVLDEQEGDSDA